MVKAYIVVSSMELPGNEQDSLFTLLVVLVEIDIHPTGKDAQRHREILVTLSRELKFKELPVYQVVLWMKRSLYCIGLDTDKTNKTFWVSFMVIWVQKKKKVFRA